MIPVIAVVGNSDSGKTTLIEKVQNRLEAKGYRVAAIKHCHHDFDIAEPGKDSWRLEQAGANPVAISSPHKLAFIERVDTEYTLSRIASLFEGKADIVLAEGYKNGHTAKILVLDPEDELGRAYSDKDVLFTVSPRQYLPGKLVFRDNDVTEIVDLLSARIAANHQENESPTQSSEPVANIDTSYQTERMERLLAESEAFHGHICPGQVLGVRMAMRACDELGIANPKKETKRLVVYVEIDRCATDAIQVVTGCKLGKRTMKYLDYGKLAATFLDLHTGNAVRIIAREDARDKAVLFSSQGQTRHEIQTEAYKVMRDEDLFRIERVKLTIRPEDAPGSPLQRVLCEECGEGINDCREVIVGGRVLCRACAYGRYYDTYENSFKEQVSL